jgi:hypothetical protein
VAPFIPDFTAVFDDISHIPPIRLKRRRMTPQGKLVLFCLRYGRTPDELFQRLPGWVDILFAVADAPDGDASIAAMLEYLQSVTRLDEEAVFMAMSEVLGESAAERIIHAADRRFEKGKREGKRDGTRSTLLRQLRARFGELPRAAIDQVQSAGSDQLDEMAVRVLTAATLDEVLAER